MDWDLDQAPISLLTVGNPKTEKSKDFGYLTAILHLAPAKLSGVANVCAYASHGCEVACLNTAGQGGIKLDMNGLNKVQAARIRRTRLLKRHKETFMEQLRLEIIMHEKKAAGLGLKLCVRLNGTSDLPWENMRLGEYKNVMDAFPAIQFYDYTKVPIRLRRRAIKQENYYLAFSLCEDNDLRAKEAIKQEINVVAVFMAKKKDLLPQKYMRRPVIDGDIHDLRFLDAPKSVVGLRAKGRGKKDTTGFVRSV